MKRKAFITGIAGQDGSYLAELLLEKDYDVYGIVRRNSTPENQHNRIDHIESDLNLEYGDLLDVSSLERMIKIIQPNEIYNIAAQSHVRISFDIPQFTVQTNALGLLNMLEGWRNNCSTARFYQASSSEMFGRIVDKDGFQRETTKMEPTSTYGMQDKLVLGNMDAYRDWGHSKDYVKAMHMIINHNVADDFVCATGVTNSVRDMCKYVFDKLDLNYKDYVTQNPKYMRAEELKYLKGDSTKIRKTLGWKPKYTFETLMDDMIEHWKKYYE